MTVSCTLAVLDLTFAGFGRKFGHAMAPVFLQNRRAAWRAKIRVWDAQLLLDARKTNHADAVRNLMRLSSFAIVLLTCCPTFAEDKPATAPGSVTALEPWASKAQPSDAAKSYVE